MEPMLNVCGASAIGARRAHSWRTRLTAATKTDLSRRSILVKDYTMYAWKCSHFSAKLRGFLNHKQVPYEEKACNLYDLVVRIPRNSGVKAMPTLRHRSGRWLADTPLIIAELEEAYPGRPCRAFTPKQRIIELLLESWLDDSLMAVSLRTRWAHAENWETLLRDEAARDLLPGAPLFLSRRFADKVFKGNMQKALAVVGLRPGGQEEQLEGWAKALLDNFEEHLSHHSYLLGEHPTAADFALLGTLAAHVNRDPWPKREWMGARPVLSAWSERLHAGQGPSGDLLPNDGFAQTLEPVIDLMLTELPIFLDQTAAAICEHVDKKGLSPGDSLPRVTRDVTAQIGGEDYVRSPFPYAVWRMQRIQSVYKTMSPQERADVDVFLSSKGTRNILMKEYGPPLERDGLGTRLAGPPPMTGT